MWHRVEAWPRYPPYTLEGVHTRRIMEAMKESITGALPLATCVAYEIWLIIRFWCWLVFFCLGT